VKRLALLLFACTPEARPFIDVAPPVASAPLVVPSATGALASASAHSGECTRSIRVLHVDPETPTCTVYGLATGVEGLLEAPCQGNGPAMARFGIDITFTGTVQNGAVHLEREWTQPIGDGCEWRFNEAITGSGSHLTVVYRERITQQSGSKCYYPCGAIGELEVR
jgi:hypothetical protein